MGIMSALRSLANLNHETRKAVRKEINLYQAIEAHLSWKRRLDDYLQGRSAETLRVHEVCLDNRCELGTWIHGSGKQRFGEIELFRQLLEEHAKFHWQASKVVEAHQSGDTARASAILSTEFSRQSRKTVDCLTKLHIEIEGPDA